MLQPCNVAGRLNGLNQHPTSDAPILQVAVDRGLCIIDIKLDNALFFDFNGAARMTTSGVYLQKVLLTSHALYVP